jgi:hypothetical protein
MFESILTKEKVTFKDLEEIAFKIACEFANEILRNMLEEYDKKIMDSRDTTEFRHKGKETPTIYQADSYHLKEKINTQVKEKEDADKLKEMFWEKEFSQMIEYVEELKYKYDGEYKEVEKLKELQKYLEKRKDSMKRYKIVK